MLKKGPFFYAAQKEFFITTKKSKISKVLVYGFFAVILTFALAFTACKDKDDESEGGTFILTGIPSEYNGKYVEIYGYDDIEVDGYQTYDESTDTSTYAHISNGSVSIPMWFCKEVEEGVLFLLRYSGNHTLYITMKLMIATQ